MFYETFCVGLIVSSRLLLWIRKVKRKMSAHERGWVDNLRWTGSKEPLVWIDPRTGKKCYLGLLSSTGSPNFDLGRFDEVD